MKLILTASGNNNNIKDGIIIILRYEHVPTQPPPLSGSSRTQDQIVLKFSVSRIAITIIGSKPRALCLDPPIIIQNSRSIVHLKLLNTL